MKIEFIDNTEEKKEESEIVYKAIKTSEISTNNGLLITGLTLIPITTNQDNYGILEEALDNLGVDAWEIIQLPELGLKEGNYYEAVATNISRDWESGHVDDYDIKIVEINYDCH